MFVRTNREMAEDEDDWRRKQETGVRSYHPGNGRTRTENLSSSIEIHPVFIERTRTIKAGAVNRCE